MGYDILERGYRNIYTYRSHNILERVCNENNVNESNGLSISQIITNNNMMHEK